jgi:hypothetical protein
VKLLSLLFFWMWVVCASVASFASIGTSAFPIVIAINGLSFLYLSFKAKE